MAVKRVIPAIAAAAVATVVAAQAALAGSPAAYAHTALVTVPLVAKSSYAQGNYLLQVTPTDSTLDVTVTDYYREKNCWFWFDCSRYAVVDDGYKGSGTYTFTQVTAYPGEHLVALGGATRCRNADYSACDYGLVQPATSTYYVDGQDLPTLTAVPQPS